MPIPVVPAVVSPTRHDASSSAEVAALVAHARAVPSAVREAFAGKLAELGTSEALVMVRTCHRVELYIALGTLGELQLPQAPRGVVRLDGADAARHLISVACGLESTVLGEDQVLHQVRQTYACRRAAGPLDPTLDRLFQVALQAGRRAREWFGGERRSLGDVALDEIERRVTTLEGSRILVVGAGSTGRLAAVAAARRGAQVLVTSRTDARALAVARDVGGQMVPWARGDLPALDGVIVALSGLWAVSDEAVRQLVDSHAPVVDLSSPLAIPDRLRAGLGELFVSVDDLAWGPQTQLRDGLRNRLETLVSESGRDYCRWLRAREAQPAIKGLTEVIERRRRSEMEWLMRRLPGLSEEETALIEQMSHRLVGGILHAPRCALNVDETGDLGRAARELFGL